MAVFLRKKLAEITLSLANGQKSIEIGIWPEYPYRTQRALPEFRELQFIWLVGVER